MRLSSPREAARRFLLERERERERCVSGLLVHEGWRDLLDRGGEVRHEDKTEEQ